MRLLATLLWLPAALSAVRASRPHDPPPAPPDTTHLVDLLSASPDHKLLLAAFQRARLIPTLNRLNGSTLFAPTDEAIRRERDGDSVWATVAHLEDQGGPSAGEREQHDNLQLALRDTLLYHVLNYTIIPAPSNNSSNSTLPAPHKPLPLDIPTLHETLYYPSLVPYNKSFPAPPTLPGTEPDRPDPDAPTDRPEGLLHGEGQRLRVIRRNQSGKNESEYWVGVDWKGEGGTLAAKPKFAVNGVLLSMDAVLHKPEDLGTLIRNSPQLSTLASLLPPPILDYLSTAPHFTLFAPTNEAWAELTDLEMRYLRSGLAEGDLSEIFGDSASQSGAGRGKVGYLQRLVGRKANGTTSLTTIRNGTLEVSAEGDRLQVAVNGTAITEGDILAKNGVIHFVPRLLLPSGSLALTAEKYLIALGATNYVALLRSVNLSHYVQIPSSEPGTIIDTPLPPPVFDLAQGQVPLGLAATESNDPPEKEKYTILAVRDDVLASSTLGATISSSLRSPILSGRPLPPNGSLALEELLRYHIVADQWRPHELEDGMLIGTELRTKALRGARQRIAVGVQGEDGSLGDGWGKAQKHRKGRHGGGGDDGDDNDDDKEMLSWGGANVVADPVVVGDSIIYLLSSLIEPPPIAITAAVSDLRLSTFVASVYAAALDGTLATQPAVTYLVPTNPAFTALGLTMQYLLLPTSRDELRSVLKYHAVDEVVYLDDFPHSGGARYPTLLDGAEIYFERESTNSTLSVHGPTLGGLPANGESRDAAIVEGDILTETGVLHVIDQVELPPDLDITLEKLMRGAKANTMLSLIRAANMTWVLDGKRAPKDDERDSIRPAGGSVVGTAHDHRDQAYTILCPTDKALSRLNLTYYHANPRALAALVRQHILPTEPASSDSGSPFPPRTALPSSPLLLKDAESFQSLLSRGQPGGKSKFGSVAFKKWGTGDDDWMVGIAGARGTKGDDAARVLAWGRATPWFVDGDEKRHNPDDERAAVFATALRRSSTRLVAAGGVISIDSVLIPYEPGWFRRWGWIVLIALIGVVLLAVAALFAVRWYRRRQARKYERLNSEEDDD
ncbi:hypothetical protein JCM10908_001028 [Rhodotorula pacifica]|uniref:uncharacterized protein n=1 Tax=Rhodotorula pacifica TaxID=1495444 RepID=UPI00316F3DC7